MPAFRRRQHVAGGHRQVDHRFGVIAPLLLVAVEQRFASFAVHHQRQLPRQVKGVAHAAVIALPLPDRHDVRGVARQQHAIDAKAFGDTRVMGVDALADRFDVVRVRQHLAQQLAHVVRLAELGLGFAGHHHKFKAPYPVRQRG